MCCEDPPTCCLYASSTLLPTPRPPGSQGMEWPILSAFDIRAWAPKLVICEIQEKQARYRGNARVQADAVALEKYFADAGCEGAGCGEELHTCHPRLHYPSLSTPLPDSILYRDMVNTVFLHRDVACVGGA